MNNQSYKLVDRYLQDVEIFNWNDEIQENVNYPNKKISIKQLHDNFNSYPSIKIEDNFEFISNFKYRLIFSVQSSKVDDFYNILKNLKKNGVPKNFVVVDGIKREFEIKEDILVVETTKFKLLEDEFTTFDFSFNGNLSHIIPYVTIIQDSLRYLKVISDDKSCKFRIGDVVSLKTNRSKNLLINSYVFQKVDRDFKVLYEASEIMENDGIVIRYGDVSIYSSNELTTSRNFKIDSILND